MKASELRELTDDELKEKCETLSQELFNLRYQKAIGQLTNTAAISKTKKDIARVKTILSERKQTGDT